MNNWGMLLYVALSPRQEKQEKSIYIPLRGKKRKEHNYFPNPLSGRPLPQYKEVLADIKDDDLRKVLEEYGKRMGFA